MLYDIIIPHLNIPEVEVLAFRCVRSIQNHSNPRDFRIIWIQNGGEIPTCVSKILQTGKHGVYVHMNSENEGFVKAVNQGLRISEAPYVVIMNNDTEAVPGWLEKLRMPLKPPVMLSGPRTTTKESWQGKAPSGSGHVILSRGAMLAFFCVMLDRKVLDVVGLLDEDFGVGFGDDDNYCARVHAAGFRLVLVQDLVIPHMHRTTFRSLYDEYQIRIMQREALKLHFDKLKKSV